MRYQRKAIEVDALRLDEAAAKAHDSKPGDYLVWFSDKRLECIPRETFERDYEPLEAPLIPPPRKRRERKALGQSPDGSASRPLPGDNSGAAATAAESA